MHRRRAGATGHGSRSLDLNELKIVHQAVWELVVTGAGRHGRRHGADARRRGQPAYNVAVIRLQDWFGLGVTPSHPAPLRPVVVEVCCCPAQSPVGFCLARIDTRHPYLLSIVRDGRYGQFKRSKYSSRVSLPVSSNRRRRKTSEISCAKLFWVSIGGSFSETCGLSTASPTVFGSAS